MVRVRVRVHGSRDCLIGTRSIPPAGVEAPLRLEGCYGLIGYFRCPLSGLKVGYSISLVGFMESPTVVHWPLHCYIVRLGIQADIRRICT